MAPLADLFERVLAGERVMAVVSTPPRFGKTETLLHGIAYLLSQHPEWQLSYIGYSSTFSEDKSRKAREIARMVGVPISDLAWARKNWRTGIQDGGVWATSITGPVTGQGFQLMLVDDPVKDRQTAESVAARAHHYSWFTDTAFTRLEPGGSCIVVQTRWHPDDLAGKLIGDGWEKINLPAINEDGESLWPERWPLSQLNLIREQIGEYGWNSLYQGEPRPRGDNVFGPANWYQPHELPTRGYSVSHGIDLAYSTKTYADRSVCWTMLRCGDLFYVVDVKIRRCKAPDFVADLKASYKTRPGKMLWYASGTEAGSADFIISNGVPLTVERPAADKFGRAQPLAAHWNAGKVLLPANNGKPPDWVEEVVGEFSSFTGVNDRHDDLVDAAAASFDALGPLYVTKTRAEDVQIYGQSRYEGWSGM